MKRGALLAVAILSTVALACAGGEAPEDLVPVLVGTVDLEIGSDTGEAPYLFGRVSGLAADDAGRIFVADAQADEIRVFDSDGVFEYSIGRSGQGPGEFGRPCCLSFGPEGRLWVRDPGNSRYQAFTLQGGRRAFDTSIPMRHSAPGLWAPLDFDDQGNLVDVGARPDPDAAQPLEVRLHLSPSGDIVSEESFAEPDPAEVGMHMVDGTIGENQVRMYIYQPYGPMHLTAHGPDRWAEAISSRYQVRLFRSESEPMDIVREAGAEVPLSATERERADAQLARDMERIGAARGQLPFDVPDRKAPLRALFFDRDRNLWVELSVAQSADREADVFDPNGQYVGRRVWPGKVPLRFGWVLGNTALGTRTDEDGVIKVVRVRFRP